MEKCGNSPKSGISAELPVMVSSPTSFVSEEDDFIKSHIFTIRGVQVMMDSDLAKIYQVETRVVSQAVKRNEFRFPPNFRFRSRRYRQHCGGAKHG